MGCTKVEEGKSTGSGALARFIALTVTAIALGMGLCHRRRSHGDEKSGERGGHGCGCRGKCCGDSAHGRIDVRSDPLRILELRFASGKIEEDEFRRRRGVLQEHLR